MREPTHAFRNRLFVNPRGLSADFGQMRQVRYRKPPSAAIRLTGDTVTVAVQGGSDSQAAHGRLGLVPLGVLWHSWEWA